MIRKILKIMKGWAEESRIKLCWKAFSALTAAPLPHPPINFTKLKLSNVTLAPDENKNTTEKVLHKKVKCCNVVNNELSQIKSTANIFCNQEKASSFDTLVLTMVVHSFELDMMWVEILYLQSSCM